jgi:hypothetical protein
MALLLSNKTLLLVDRHRRISARITSLDLRDDLWESLKINTLGEILRRD